MNDISILIARIDALLSSRGDDDPEIVADMESTLTDGYAQALALEGERWRLQQEIGEITSGIAAGGKPRTKELASLVRRLAASETELADLRGTLNSLRERIAFASGAAEALPG
jgi:hypothetical protein